MLEVLKKPSIHLLRCVDPYTPIVASSNRSNSTPGLTHTVTVLICLSCSWRCRYCSLPPPPKVSFPVPVLGHLELIPTAQALARRSPTTSTRLDTSFPSIGEELEVIRVMEREHRRALDVGVHAVALIDAVNECELRGRHDAQHGLRRGLHSLSTADAQVPVLFGCSR
uniref:Uncharacterized protein n=1 Tax=Arundo donax TaxID=35708 RepID=A0A0A8YKQ7_ARUDO